MNLETVKTGVQLKLKVREKEMLFDGGLVTAIFTLGTGVSAAPTRFCYGRAPLAGYNRNFSSRVPILLKEPSSTQLQRARVHDQPRLVGHQDYDFYNLNRERLSAQGFTFRQFLGVNAHLGHRTGAVDSKMMEFLLGRRNGFYVINLLRSFYSFRAGIHVIVSVVAKRGKVLFSNPDKFLIAGLPSYLRQFCLRYVIVPRKLPGILSNFIFTKTHYTELRYSAQVPSFALALNKYDHHVLKEADSLNVPSLGIFDSNTNPIGYAFYAAPGNDDSILGRFFYAKLAFRAIHTGHRKFLLGWFRKKYKFLRRWFQSFHSFFYRRNRYHGFYDHVSAYYYVVMLRNITTAKVAPRVGGLNSELFRNMGASMRTELDELKLGLIPQLRSDESLARLLSLFFKSRIYRFLNEFSSLRSPLFLRGFLEESAEVSQLLLPHSSFIARGQGLGSALLNRTTPLSIQPPLSKRSLQFILDERLSLLETERNLERRAVFQAHHLANTFRLLCFDHSWLDFRIDMLFAKLFPGGAFKLRRKFLNFLYARQHFVRGLYTTYRSLFALKRRLKPRSRLYIKQLKHAEEIKPVRSAVSKPVVTLDSEAVKKAQIERRKERRQRYRVKAAQRASFLRYGSIKKALEAKPPVRLPKRTIRRRPLNSQPTPKVQAPRKPVPAVREQSLPTGPKVLPRQAAVPKPSDQPQGKKNASPAARSLAVEEGRLKAGDLHPKDRRSHHAVKNGDSKRQR